MFGEGTRVRDMRIALSGGIAAKGGRRAEARRDRAEARRV